MSYQVLARKWRPSSFDQVVGQGHVLRALINGLDTDRLHHAYLFTGTRGVGKTSLARVLAKALNCEQGVSSAPCGACTSCREVDEGRFVDLIEVDAASRTKVDETRDLLDNVQYAPTRGRYKVYLIDEVHMFSTHSFNALLKTLEEPPPHVKFLLATTDPKKLPATILSRCLQFNLKRITVDQLIDRLSLIVEAEGVPADESSLSLIAHAADGSVRDSLSLLDQAIAYGGGELRQPEVAAMLGTIATADVTAIVEKLADDDGAALIAFIRELAKSAPDYHHVLGELLSLLRRIAVYQALGDEASVIDEGNDVIGLAQRLSPEDCQLFYQIGLVGRRDMSLASDPQSGFEMVLLRMLAFRPVEADFAVREKSTPTKPLKRSISPASAGRQPKSPLKKVSENVNLVAPATEIQADMVSVPAIGESSTPMQSQESEELDWNEMVSKLELHGLVRELARNAALKAYDGKVVELLLKPQHENLSGDRLKQGLEKALKQQLNADIRVHLALEKQAELDTPSKRSHEAEKARKREAEKVIKSDETVQALQNEFGATIERVDPK